MKTFRGIATWLGKRPILVLAAVFVLFCCAYEYGRILHLRPLPHHLMRQSDCLGPAYNYCFYDGNLFHPCMNNLHADDNNGPQSAGEFPLLYWIVGMLWRVIGQSELAYRLIGVLLHFVGSIALFRVAARVLGSERWGGWIAMLFFTSPAVAYFAISFLPDVPAFDLAMLGAYALMRYRDGLRTRHLVLAFLAMAVGAMLKVTSGFTLLALMGVLSVETLWQRKLRDRWRMFPQLLKAWSCAIVAVLMVIGWYVYADRYNQVHGAPYTPNSTWPLWSASENEVNNAWRFAREVLVFELFPGVVWLLVIAALVLMVSRVRRLPLPLLLLNLFVIIGCVLFVLLWFRALNNHDYYFINPSIVVPLVLTTGLWALFQRWPSLRNSAWSLVAGALVLGLSLAYTTTHMRMRTYGEGLISRETLWPLYNEAQFEHWKETQYWSMKPLVDIEPYNRSIGIKRDDLVIVVQDRTWQVSLYLMGQRGWNDYTVYLSDSTTVDHYAREHGASYLFVTEPAWLEKPYMRSFLQRPIGRFNDARIYDLRYLH